MLPQWQPPNSSMLLVVVATVSPLAAPPRGKRVKQNSNRRDARRLQMRLMPVSATGASSTRGLIPAVGVLREARALYPHNAEAMAGRRLHDDPALGAIHHRRAQPFKAAHLGGNVVGLDVYVHAALNKAQHPPECRRRTALK